MVVVALAGASSGFGFRILQSVIATKKHDVILLSRSEQLALSSEGVDVRVVDYDDKNALIAALKGVHTVISAIGSFDPSVFQTSQLSLLNAAKEAGVKRFAPSEFAHQTHEGIDMYGPKKNVWEAVKASGLEYTRFSCGIFMNIFATGTPKGEQEALSGLRAWNFVFNIAAGTADLPGDGTAPVTFTEISDIGRFVAASLDLEHWDAESGMVGETMSFNQVVQAVERVTNRRFLVKHNSMEEMAKLAEDPPQRFYNQVRMAIARGDFQVKASLNAKFPDIAPIRVNSFVERWWAGVTLETPKWAEDKYFG